jgi:tungstate transport system ATP-binding protein
MKLSATDLVRNFDGKRALSVKNLEFETGSLSVITGPNGAGKTTLVRVLGLIDRAESGVVKIDDMIVPPTGPVRLDMRRRMTAVFSEPKFFSTSVWRNVTYGLRMRKVARSERRVRGLQALQTVGLQDFAGRKAAELSSGESQRLALARALVLEPEILFLDEPFFNLDEENAAIVRKLIPTLVEKDRTVILITHDLEFAAGLDADRIYMRKGQIVEHAKK